jgi:hypothetical protein
MKLRNCHEGKIASRIRIRYQLAERLPSVIKLVARGKFTATSEGPEIPNLKRTTQMTNATHRTPLGRLQAGPVATLPAKRHRRSPIKGHTRTIRVLTNRNRIETGLNRAPSAEISP